MRLPSLRSWAGPVWLSLGLAVLGPQALQAELVRFEITSREPFAAGESFGDAGPYEKLVGRVLFSLDPDHPANHGIVDLDFAERDTQGRVQFDADLVILAPRDPALGNGVLLYEVNNRGNKLALSYLNNAGGNAADKPGNGFLMRQGYTVVWSGWDGELLPGNQRLQLRPPTARATATGPITGRVRYEICTHKLERRRPVNGGSHGAFSPTESGLEQATLSWRLRPKDARVSIPRTQFQLHVTESDKPGQLPEVELELPAGLQPGYLYELIYEAREPQVHGTCFASVRDLIDAFKEGSGVGNPFAAQDFQWAYGFGVSQSGRFLREFTYSGFNCSEGGRQVFDGLLPHVAGGGLGSFNHRFAQPTSYARQHEHHDWGTDRFPFSYEVQTNPFTQTQDGILEQSEAAGVSPKIFHTQSSTEYWSRSGSLPHTDPTGSRDATLPENVRIFAFGGTQHGYGRYPPSLAGQTLRNPADYRPLLRALLVALDAWCRQGTPPPDSVYPRIDAGTLVAPSQTGFPKIPGIRYPEVWNYPRRLDWGSRWAIERIIDQQPPRALESYTTLVPACDAAGNERGCLLPPEVEVPFATYSGWNLRAPKAGVVNELVGLSGSFIPFAKIKAERRAAGDPRKSFEELYGSIEGYRKQLAKYCQHLVDNRLLLQDEVEELVAQHAEHAETWLTTETDPVGSSP